MSRSVQEIRVDNENSREKAIALDFARRAALAIFSTGVEPIVWPYDEEALRCEDRHPVMNERPCDHEENGTRAWRGRRDGVGKPPGVDISGRFL
jgi:hypothetical protein